MNENNEVKGAFTRRNFMKGALAAAAAMALAPSLPAVDRQAEATRKTWQQRPKTPQPPTTRTSTKMV